MWAAHVLVYSKESHRCLSTNKTYVCHILWQQWIALKWNLLKSYPGKSSGSQVWELRPCEGGKSSSRLKGWQIPPSARGSATVANAWMVSEKFDIQAPKRKFYQWQLGVGKDAHDVWGHRRSERRLERGHSGVGDKVRWRWRRRRALALTPVTARACFVYTPGVRSCQTGMAQAWSEPWLIARGSGGVHGRSLVSLAKWVTDTK